MTYDQIQAFLAVVQYESITCAASKLFLAQPTVSHRIDSLETELGAKLFNRQRGSRHATLTDEGREFVGQAQKWSELWNETQSIFAARKVPTLTIVASRSISSYLLPDACWRFMQHGLDYHVDFKAVSMPEGIHVMNSGRADIAIYPFLHYPDRDDISALDHDRIRVWTDKPLLDEKMVFACSVETNLPDDFDVSTLSTDKEVFLNWGTEFRAWHDHCFGEDATPYVTTDFLVIAERFLRERGCWSIIPQYVANVLVARGFCQLREISPSPSHRPFYIATKRGEKYEQIATVLSKDIMDVLNDYAEGRIDW